MTLSIPFAYLSKIDNLGEPERNTMITAKELERIIRSIELIADALQTLATVESNRARLADAKAKNDDEHEFHDFMTKAIDKKQ